MLSQFVNSKVASTACSLAQTSGVHNDVRAEGKGRSVQRPHKRLYFENFLMVAHTNIASLTNDSASKAAK